MRSFKEECPINFDYVIAFALTHYKSCIMIDCSNYALNMADVALYGFNSYVFPLMIMTVRVYHNYNAYDFKHN